MAIKVADLAVAVASALGLDSSHTVKIKNAIDVSLAADKAKDKAKDEGGLGPVEIMKGKDKAKDKAKDAEKDDPESTNAKDKMDDEDGAKDEKDDKAEDGEESDEVDGADEVQPKESVTGGGAPAGNKGKEPVKDKKAMDTAIKLAIDARDALHAARRDVEGVIGAVTYDSAAEVYGAALKKLGVDAAGITTAAGLRTLFNVARDKATAGTPEMATDAAGVASMAEVFGKHYTRI